MKNLHFACKQMIAIKLDKANTGENGNNSVKFTGE